MGVPAQTYRQDCGEEKNMQEDDEDTEKSSWHHPWHPAEMLSACCYLHLWLSWILCLQVLLKTTCCSHNQKGRDSLMLPRISFSEGWCQGHLQWYRLPSDRGKQPTRRGRSLISLKTETSKESGRWSEARDKQNVYILRDRHRHIQAFDPLDEKEICDK